ncbi:MAG: glutamyl-tRNA reductase, partial [Phototrophicales bacterium]
GEEPSIIVDAVLGFLAKYRGVPLSVLKKTTYSITEKAVAEHLMRVASGLDSAILGESQILGQVKDAYEIALQFNTCGSILARMFNAAIHVGKQVRTYTPIGDKSTSISHAAVELIRQNISNFKQTNILIIGTGQMGVLAAQILKKQGIGQLMFINRTYERADGLAREVGGRAIAWQNMREAMAQANIVVVSTGAPHYILSLKDIQLLIQNDHHIPQLFIDLAMPRNIDPAIGTLSNIRLFNLDHLQTIANNDLELYEVSIPIAEQLIAEALETFWRWREERQVVPVLVDFRHKINQLAHEEVEFALQRLSNLSERDRAIINRLMYRVVNKILHNPTQRLKQAAVTSDAETYIKVLQDLFDLNTLSISEINT